jgi:hypothetical protein
MSRDRPGCGNGAHPFQGAPVCKAILTDSQFWVPVAALALGVALLVALQ